MLVPFHQGRDDVAEGHQGEVYLCSLLQSNTLSPRLGLALRALRREKEAVKKGSIPHVEQLFVVCYTGW